MFSDPDCSAAIKEKLRRNTREVLETAQRDQVLPRWRWQGGAWSWPCGIAAGKFSKPARDIRK